MGVFLVLKVNLDLEKLKLKIINKDDYEFLFELLCNRPKHTNISHKQMPSMIQHIKFINSKPYSKWYVVIYDKIRVGSTYLTKHNEIGLFITPKWAWRGLEPKVLECIKEKNPRSMYYANVNPRNTKLINLFKKNGFTLIQYTYELIN